MRRNGVLAERMKEGDPDAWNDPVAIFEILADPSIEMAEGAAMCAYSVTEDGGRWGDTALSNVSSCLSSAWNMIHVDYKILMIKEVCKRDIGVAANVAMVIYGFCKSEGVFFDQMSGKPVPIPNLVDAIESIEVFIKSKNRSMARRLCRPYLVDHFESKTVGYAMQSSILKSLVYICAGYGSIDKCISNIRSKYGEKIVHIFQKAFPDPIIWVPDNMVKNGRRRR